MKAKLHIIFYFFWISFSSVAQISGVVLDKTTKEPIPFAKISIVALNLNTTTDLAGEFAFEKVPLLAFDVKVSAFDYETILQRIDFSEARVQLLLEAKHTVFEEVMVSTSEGRLQNENITSVAYRSKENLFQTGATTLGEALTSIPGVQQTTIGTGISRPVIRGLSGNRVITYWEGLRVENQQWGEDHGMATSELGLKGVEVVKGPASLIYGADAVGGVIQYHDEEYVSKGETVIYAATKLESNSMGTTNELGYKVAGEKFKLNVFGNFVSHTDFQLPNGQFLDNSRFMATNWKAALGYRNNNYVSNLRYHFSHSQIGIPGHTHDLVPDETVFMTNRRGLRSPKIPAKQEINNHFLIWENKVFFKRSDLNIQVGNTSNHLREFDHDPNTPFINLFLNNSTYHVRYHYHLSERSDIRVGSQGMLQVNRNLENTESYLLPDANTLDLGGYAIFNHDLSNKWRFQSGLRFDYRSIETFQDRMDTLIESNIDMDPLSRAYNTLNYAAGFVRNTKRSTWRFNASSGFRAPHLAELLANGVHHGSLRYEQGDRNLVSENALQLDMSMELHFDHFEFIFNPYVSFVKDFIYLSVTDSVVSNNVGTFPYFEFAQTDRALLYGGEVAFHYHPHQLHRLHLESSFAITVAENELGTPINLIPQPNFTSRVRFDINNKNKFVVQYLVLEHQQFLAQNRVAPLERASSAFGIFNVSAKMKWEAKQNIDFHVGVRNLLNTTYIPHLSVLKNLGANGVANPGINIFAKVAMRIETKKPSSAEGFKKL